MKCMRNKFFKIALIFILALFIRLYALGSVPPHLTPDEAALGYNAYSILKTGKDEHGVTLPLIFKSFGDFKPGLYVYLATLPISVFGLNEFAVRLPSALLGAFSVIIFYEIAKLLMDETKDTLKHFPTLTALFLALSPWHIQFSRGAWEVNVAAFFILCGMYFHIKSLKKSESLVWAVIFYAFSLLTYQGAKLMLVISGIVVTIFSGIKIYSKNSRLILGSLVLFLIVGSPIIASLFTGQAGRLGVFSVFSYPRPKEYLETFLVKANETQSDVVYPIFHSETLNFARGIAGRWFNHFSGRFLFFEGDWQNPRHSAPYHGMLTLFDLPLLLIGIYFLLITKNNRLRNFIFVWVAIAPFPAILSRDQIHAVRSFQMLFPLTLILAYGVASMLNVKYLKIFVVGVILYFVSYLYFLDMYFTHTPTHNSKYWEYGYKDIVTYVSPIKDNYNKIIVQQSYAQPYIYFLFYNKYDPSTYQKMKNYQEGVAGDVGIVTKLDNIYFEWIDWPVIRGEKNSIVVADIVKVPPLDSQDSKEFTLMKEIWYLDKRELAFRIIEIK